MASSAVPLLPHGPLDDSMPLARHQQSCWQRWKGRVVSIGGALGSLAVRVANLSPWSNVVSSFGVGFFTQAALVSGREEKALAKIRQVSMTCLGQVTLFLVSQIYQNVNNGKIQEACDHAIVIFLGANVCIFSHWLSQGPVRSESHALKDEAGDKFQILNRNARHIIHIILSGGCSALAKFINDPIIEKVATFGACLFAAQVLGERCVIAINHNIERNDSDQGTVWRAVKTVFTTASYFFLPLSMVPWFTEPDLYKLGFSGGVIGTLNGILEESQMARFESHPIRALKEFNFIDETSRIFNIWKMMADGFAVTSVTGFTIWQMGWELKDPDAQAAIGSMCAAFVSTKIGLEVVARQWDAKTSPRHGLKDRVMVFAISSNQFLYLYYAIINALKMDSQETQVQSPLHRVAIITGWFAYGSAMAIEHAKTSSLRRGSAETNYTVMLFFNAANTMKLMLQRKIR